jgi:hypothetical protein
MAHLARLLRLELDPATAALGHSARPSSSRSWPWSEPSAGARWWRRCWTPDDGARARWRWRSGRTVAAS